MIKKVLLVVYDNAAYISEFPVGLGYVAAVLRNAGYYVEVYNQDKYHYPEEHLTEYLGQNKFDVIGVSVVAGYYQYRKLLKISDAINKARNRPFYIIGGHGPAPEADFFLRKTKADAVVIGEGEITIIELMKVLQEGGSLKNVKGIAFRKDGETIITEPRPLIEDVDTIPFPAYDLFPIHVHRLVRYPNSTNLDFSIPVLSGRGCTFECSFCYRLDKGFRPRSNAGIIEEIKFLKKKYSISYIAFYDELLMSSKERTVSLCEDFIKANLNIKWSCNGRLNYAIQDVLETMRKAGCVFINYGIEAMDDEVLKNMKKGLTTKMITAGVEATLKAGISPGLNIIFGNIGDTRETLMKGVEFLLRYDDQAQFRTIRPVTPYPGCPLYYYALEKGLLKDVEDFYENKHTNSDLLTVNLTDMSDGEFYSCLAEANAILARNYYQKQQNNTLKQIDKLYKSKDASFRGFRQT